jgi:hypothetical protein
VWCLLEGAPSLGSSTDDSKSSCRQLCHFPVLVGRAAQAISSSASRVISSTVFLEGLFILTHHEDFSVTLEVRVINSQLLDMEGYKGFDCLSKISD